MFLEDLRQAIGVLGQVLQRHRAIFDEGDRLAVALHGHHDVQPGLADFPQAALLGCIGDLDHRAGKAEIPEQFFQAREPLDQGIAIVASEFDQQDRVRVTQEETFHHRPELVVLACEGDHGAVDQFHRIRVETDDLLGQLHGAVETGKVRHAQHLVPWQRRQLQVQAAEPGERPLGPDQEMRQIVRQVRLHHVEVVALDAPQHARPARLDLGRLTPRDGMDGIHDVAITG